MGFREEARENHLKKKVEEALRSKMKARALKECDHYVALFSECAQGRTFSVVWSCREQAKKMNECLHQYTNDQVLEEYKKNYVAEQEGRSKL